MRVAIVLLAVVLTACGCGKKEAPKEHYAKGLPWNCNEVRIISTDGKDVLMERTDGTRIRYIREGNYGNAGDVFALCEN